MYVSVGFEMLQRIAKTFCCFLMLILFKVGGLEHFLFVHTLGRIIPTDFHIFQRGRYTPTRFQIHIVDVFSSFLSAFGFLIRM